MSAKQGSLLPPVLLVIYTAETVGAKYRKATENAYADDNAIYSCLISTGITL